MLTDTNFLDNAFRLVALQWVAAAVVGILFTSAVEYVVRNLPL